MSDFIVNLTIYSLPILILAFLVFRGLQIYNVQKIVRSRGWIVSWWDTYKLITLYPLNTIKSLLHKEEYKLTSDYQEDRRDLQNIFFCIDQRQSIKNQRIAQDAIQEYFEDHKKSRPE